MVMLKPLFLFIILMLFAGCKKTDDSNLDFKKEMRSFVKGISQYARSSHPDFIVIPQNGQELLTENGESDGVLDTAYINAIDGQGREDLFYGYNADNESTPTPDRAYMQAFLDPVLAAGKTVLATDYCSDPGKMMDSYAQNSAKGYVSFAADHRELDNIPAFPSTIVRENNAEVTQISQAKNFLYLINPANFSKDQFLAAVRATNYDVLICDLNVNDLALTASEVDSLKPKQNGGKRLVICYMSIGEAENYRFYWKSNWKKGSPNWIAAENPDWAGNYKVRYWEKEWQALIFGNDQSYTRRILDAHFDGVYLDIIDAFEYFE